MQKAAEKLAANPPTCRIFEYKGVVGAEIDMDNGKFINNPGDPGQLGCVINTADVAISPTAAQIISRARREGGSFATLMLTKHADGSGSSIGIMGFGKVMLGKALEIGRDCDTSVLKDCTICELEAPKDFQKFIDKGNK